MRPLGTIALLVAIVVLGGCGGGAAPPAEAPHRVPPRHHLMPRPEEPPVEAEEPPADSPSSHPPNAEMPAANAAIAPVEPGSHSAVIRSYLAAHFLRASWYRKVHAVVLGDFIATVLTSLPRGSEGRASAMEACRAVMQSGRAKKAVVIYGSTSSLVC